MSKFAREKIIKGNQLLMPSGNAICYSGYRDGQSPQTNDYPSYEEILEDLQLLSTNWQYLRLYDCSQHALTVLKVIRDNNLAFKVMLGVDLGAEVSNPNCPWGADYSDDVLQQNRAVNERDINSLITIANEYSDIAFAASIGNEASVEWNDHMVPVERLVAYATLVKNNIAQPVTFCENYVPWLDKLKPLVEVVDFISIHTYPVWEYQTIESALSYTEQNYQSVAQAHPNKPIVITEAGWTTNSNGCGIEAWNASVQLQAEYCAQLHTWSKETNILTFMFEAFDEPWKGSSDANEPEKHWGFFDVNRVPKLVMRRIFAS
jgi:exo-beta-1,3-glucanase (GH17 family)